ncbi:MAG: hypothetical protein NXI08_16815, partial [bacterium]|nr:hypothetical protein [bacterium]
KKALFGANDTIYSFFSKRQKNAHLEGLGIYVYEGHMIDFDLFSAYTKYAFARNINQSINV